MKGKGYKMIVAQKSQRRLISANRDAGRLFIHYSKNEAIIFIFGNAS